MNNKPKTFWEILEEAIRITEGIYEDGLGIDIWEHDRKGFFEVVIARQGGFFQTWKLIDITPYEFEIFKLHHRYIHGDPYAEWGDDDFFEHFNYTRVAWGE